MFAICLMGGTLMASPDVCKTPSPGGPVPTPYVNVGNPALGNPASNKVMISGSPALNQKSEIPLSSGDEAGVSGGMISGKFIGKVKFLSGSTKVMIEGSPAVKLGDSTGHNENNIVGSCVAPSQTKVMIMS